MKYLKKTRTKFILSKSGLLYKIVLCDNNEQLEIIWLTSNLPRIYRRKRYMHYAFCDKGLNLEILKEETKSVTYRCPKDLQKDVLRIISKS